MNVERILELADHIEQLEHYEGGNINWNVVDAEDLEGFSMTLFSGNFECGTAGCIGGWACKLFAPEASDCDRGACEALGLTREQADMLFFPNGMPGITPSQAAACLRLVAAGTDPGRGVGQRTMRTKTLIRRYCQAADNPDYGAPHMVAVYRERIKRRAELRNGLARQFAESLKTAETSGHPEEDHWK